MFYSGLLRQIILLTMGLCEKSITSECGQFQYNPERSEAIQGWSVGTDKPSFLIALCQHMPGYEQAYRCSQARCRPVSAALC